MAKKKAVKKAGAKKSTVEAQLAAYAKRNKQLDAQIHAGLDAIAKGIDALGGEVSVLRHRAEGKATPHVDGHCTYKTGLFDHFVLNINPGTPVFALPAGFTDERGTLQPITHSAVGSVVLITSKGDTTRAKHWHKEDSHLCYVVSGVIEYYERPTKMGDVPKSGSANDEPVVKHTFTAGQAFITGPNIEHEMFFPVDTVFLTLGNRHRTQADYEKDLVRLDVSLRDAYNAQS